MDGRLRNMDGRLRNIIGAFHINTASILKSSGDSFCCATSHWSGQRELLYNNRHFTALSLCRSLFNIRPNVFFQHIFPKQSLLVVWHNVLLFDFRHSRIMQRGRRFHEINKRTAHNACRHAQTRHCNQRNCYEHLLVCDTQQKQQGNQNHKRKS